MDFCGHKILNCHDDRWHILYKLVQLHNCISNSYCIRDNKLLDWHNKRHHSVLHDPLDLPKWNEHKVVECILTSHGIRDQILQWILSVTILRFFVGLVFGSIHPTTNYSLHQRKLTSYQLIFGTRHNVVWVVKRLRHDPVVFYLSICQHRYLVGQCDDLILPGLLLLDCLRNSNGQLRTLAIDDNRCNTSL